MTNTIEQAERLRAVAVWMAGSKGSRDSDCGYVVGHHFQMITMCPDPDGLAELFEALPDLIAQAERAKLLEAALMTMEWIEWSEAQPDEGQKVVIVCDDGMSSSLALMSAAGPLDGEDGEPLGNIIVNGAIWLPLPSNYPLGFMEVTDADWY